VTQKNKREKKKDTPTAPSFQNPASALPASRERMRELLLESSRVTSSQRGQEIEIQLGHFCNNRCVFCASGQLTEQGLAQPVGKTQVFNALEEAAAAGVRRVTFLGGEPTVQESLLPALRRAISLGFEDVVIFTNGVRTGDERYVEQIAEIGRFSWRFSIQGGDEEAHDTAVGRPGAFSRLIAGLKHLQVVGHPVTSNMCVTTHAVDSLSLLPELLLSHGITQMCIDMVRPVSVGERNDAWMTSMLPRFSDLAPALDEMLQEFERQDPGFDINITHLPFCQLPKWGHKISHGGAPTLTFTADLNHEQGVVDKYDFQAEDRKLLPECEGCVFETRCTGVPHEYARLYGSSEIRAISREKLIEADPDRNNFPLLISEELRQLSNLPTPHSWHLGAVDQEHRQRFAAMHWQHADGHDMSIRLMSPALPTQAGWFEALCTSEYRVAFRAGHSQDVKAQAALLQWFIENAGKILGEASDANEPNQLLKQYHRAQSWMQKALHTLQYTDRLGPWTLSSVDTVPQGAELILEHPEHPALTILISQSTSADAPPLSFEVVNAQTHPEDMLQEASTALSSVLRG